MKSAYQNCMLCPRRCGVDRTSGKTGFCGQSAQMKIAYAGLHSGEEPVLIRGKGSGTIFFSGCTLQCCFCQNYQLSRSGMGREITEEEFTGILFSLQEQGASNINLVSGTQFIPSIINSIKGACKKGFRLPVVWNTSGFETPASLLQLNEIVDVYCSDVKTLSADTSASLFSTPAYPEVVKNAVEQMIKKKPLEFKGESLVRGVILRHCVLPAHIGESCSVLKWLDSFGSNKFLVSLMFQYSPCGENLSESINRTVNEEEYSSVMSCLDELPSIEGFVQDLTDSEAWLPDFSRKNPFETDLSKSVWHWLEK